MADVRLFAGLRDAAGTARTVVDAATVAELVDLLTRRFGERFAAGLARSKIVVDGQAVPHDSDRALSADSEVVLLPPFSGG